MSTQLLPVADRRTTAAFSWQLLRARRAQLAVTVVAFVGSGLAGLVPPWLIGRLVDAVRDGAGGDAALVAGVGSAIAAVVGGLLTWLAVRQLATVSEPALAVVREDVFGTALSLDSATVERAGSGDLLSRVGDDVRSVSDALVNVVPVLAQSAVAVVLTVVGLVAIDWRLALAGLVTAPFYVAALRWYLRSSGPFYAEERIAQGERAQAVLDGVQESRTLRAFGWAPAQLAGIDRASDRARRITVDVFVLLTRFFGRNNRAEYIGLACILGVGFVLVRSDSTSVGAVTAAALLFHRLFNPIGALLGLFDDLQSAAAALARLAGVALLPERRVGVPQESTRRASRAEPLSLHGVTYGYDAGPPAIQEIDLTLAPGELVAVVGATGAGKTTLGTIAAGVLVPSGGRVLLGDRPLPQDRLRDDVVIVSQEVHVFAATLRENLVLADGAADDDRLLAALHDVGAGGWATALPAGLDTRVGDGAHALTAAQAQQLALARVLLRDPQVVVLDEATAEAGSQGAQELEAGARAVTRGRTALVVAHRLTQSASADRVLVMEAGRIVESGRHEQLIAGSGRYARLWRAWSAPGTQEGEDATGNPETPADH